MVEPEGTSKAAARGTYIGRRGTDTESDWIAAHRSSYRTHPGSRNPHSGDLSSGLHLCQRPMYRASGGSWHASYRDALGSSGSELSWDVAAILAAISFHYAVGKKTLVNEITRQPWLSRIDDDGSIILSDIPPHGLHRDKIAHIAENLEELLYEEARRACDGRREIYVLLSGGLDSRIVAGTVARLQAEGRLDCKPCGMTWGLEDSRDVVYGRLVAEAAGLDWIHINISPMDILRNIDISASMGNFFPPLDLHCMSWFANVSRDALVLAGSYGDSVGRAEYSGRHVLELDYHAPQNLFGLVRPELCDAAAPDIAAELDGLRLRAPGAAKYVICEHEQQGHYMRSMIAQAMSLIGDYCTIYQMFTDPSVYSYMWSIHPSLRDNGTYACLMERLDARLERLIPRYRYRAGRLARLPWARTNRALCGGTIGARHDLRREFHLYSEWISGMLYKYIREYVDPDWYGATGIFDPDRVRRLGRLIKHARWGLPAETLKPYSVWTWLAGLRRFAELCEENGKRIELRGNRSAECSGGAIRLRAVTPGRRNPLRRILGRSEKLKNIKREVHRRLLKMRALRAYPPHT